MSIISGVRTPNEIIRLVLEDYEIDQSIADKIEDRLNKGMVSVSDNKATLVIIAKKNKLEWAYVDLESVIKQTSPGGDKLCLCPGGVGICGFGESATGICKHLLR